MAVDFNVDWDFAVFATPTTATATSYRIPNTDGVTSLVITGTGFTYDGNGIPTGGTITSVALVTNDGNAALMTETNLHVGLGDYGTALSSYLAIRSQISWANIVGGDGQVTFSPTVIRLPNADGSFTDIIGTSLDVTGSAITGSVTAVNHVDVDGSTILEHVVVSASLATVASGLIQDVASDQLELLLHTGDNTFTSAPGATVINNVNYVTHFEDGGGNDTFVGNATGTSFVELGELASQGLTANLATGTATIGAETNTLTNILGVGGSDFNDTLIGDANGNRLTGHGGDDTLSGAAGNDFIDGGLGNDTIDGGDGGDTVGYRGDDLAGGVTVSLAIATAQDTGGAGIDIITNFENIQGSVFDDVLTGNAGGNVLIGDLGNDTLTGGDGGDVLDGGDGVDWADYSTAAAGLTARLLAPAGNTGEAAGDTYNSIENLRGSAFNDVLSGTAGVNTLEGGLGNDQLIGSAGADVLNGGDGSDFASYANATAFVWAQLISPGTNQGDAAGDTYISIENVIGSNFGDLIDGDNNNNILIGLGGNDTLRGQDGDDVLIGGAGADALGGGAGTDTADYTLAAAAVTINFATGTGTGGDAQGDTYTSVENANGSAFDDTFVSKDVVANFFNGNGGLDTLDYSAAAAAVGVNLFSGAVSGNAVGDTFASIENLAGSAFNDSLFGDAGNNVLSGNAGDDLLIGAGGVDQYFGGDGNDTVFLGDVPVGTVLNGGLGTDTLRVGDHPDDPSIGRPVSRFDLATLNSFESVEFVNTADKIAIFSTAQLGAGLSTTATIFGNSASQDIVAVAMAAAGSFDLGASTNFTLLQWAATDYLMVIGSGGNDTITGTAGNDYLNGEFDTVTGFGNDIVNGLAGNDILEGWQGIDQLHGGIGDDLLTGWRDEWTTGEVIDGGDGFDTLGVGTGGVINFSQSTITSIEALDLSKDADATGGDVVFGAAQLGGGLSSTLAVNGMATANDHIVINGAAATAIDLSGWTFTNWHVPTSFTLSLGVLTGAANDIVVIDGASVADTITGSSQSDAINGNGGNDVIHGGAGVDFIDGSAGTDQIFGDDGNDLLNVFVGEANGAETVNGGLGFDTLSLEGGDINVGAFTLASIESVRLTQFTGAETTLAGRFTAAQVASGLDAALQVVGSAATDRFIITGVNGVFSVAGWTFSSWGANDHVEITGGTGVDTITGTSINDIISGGAGNDTFIGTAGADQLGGDGGVDTVDYSASASAVTVNFKTGAGSGGDAAGDTYTLIENVTGSAFNDTLIGKDNIANTLNGGDGDDILSGGTGGVDTLNGGNGIDTLDYTESLTGVDVRLFAGTAAGGSANNDTYSSIENLIGSTKADTLVGTDTVNTIHGGVGSDTILGRDGDDFLYGEAGNDSQLGGNGQDTLYGSAGADTLGGGADNDTVDYSASAALINVSLQAGSGTGGDAQGDVLVSIENVIGTAFNDVIAGKNNWDNIIDGGAGADTLSGGTGNDTFVFHAGQANGDTISDFAKVVGNHDHLSFIGYGTAAQGATFTQVDATHWTINSSDGTIHETITLSNGVTPLAGDIVFG